MRRCDLLPSGLGPTEGSEAVLAALATWIAGDLVGGWGWKVRGVVQAGDDDDDDDDDDKGH